MRRLPSFFALRAFEAAARHESFAAAGVELHLTPSAISHQVRALEAWFGRALFMRTTRQVALTDDGRRLLGELSPAFDVIEDACAALRPPGPRRALAVHCAPSFAAKWLSPRLADFMHANPSITIRLSSSAEPVDLRQDESVDVDIAYGVPRRQAGVVIEPLGKELTLPLCSPALLARCAKPASGPKALVELPLIESKLNPVQWADWCRLNRVKLPNRARPSFDRGSLAVAAAVDGLGVALETTRFAEAELQNGQLVAIDGPGFQRVERDMHCMCYRRVDQQNPQLVAFARWLGARLGVAPLRQSGAAV